MIGFAKTIETNAALVRAANTAETVDLRFSASDPNGHGNRRDVVLAFRDDAAAQAFLAALRATSPAANAAPSLSMTVLTPR
ncbi:hypothetical protein [Gemmata sp. SH-PL17]|uniref:hypothetical protein n=1 Tax=Gemmata sp. SH-PL17 TaxID=1630693 RepID=UPI0012F7EB73|nr:hypothetical protein [Gemmata sp. SH-PL17]